MGQQHEPPKALNAEQRLNAKRVIQVLMPTVPVPMVDYALHTEMAANLVNAGGMLEPHHSRGFVVSSTDTARVADFVELHLLAPAANNMKRIGQRGPKPSFGDLRKLTFSLDEPSDAPRAGTSARPASAMAGTNQARPASLLTKAHASSTGIPVAAAAPRRVSYDEPRFLRTRAKDHLPDAGTKQDQRLEQS
mmetsp:Transcript_76279/g.168446  ORF Transcript_76279/g.168446 Transcript_76279/m.168446 type:complete len:192 (-) Transcript_76279:209-784(-)